MSDLVYIDPLEYDYDSALWVMFEMQKTYIELDHDDDWKDHLRTSLNNFFIFFADEIKADIETHLEQNKNVFCIMAPAAGPYYIDPRATIEVKPWLSSIFEIVIDKTWVGHLYLRDKKCGINNLEKLMR